MSFADWFFTRYPGASHVKPWGLGEILTLILCIAIIVTLAILFKKKDDKTKRIVLWVLVGLIIFFEVVRRIANLISNTNYTFNSYLHILLPRPWCAIACWTLIVCVISKKKCIYNFASITALLCAIIFFAYPGVGFKSPYFLFDDLYSVATHSLLLITSISLMTLGFTDFNYKEFWKVGVCYAVIFVYSILEIYVLKIEHDPMYFMPNNDVQDILGISYGLYLTIYIIFTLFYFNLFPLIQWLKTNRPITRWLHKRKQTNNDVKIESSENTEVADKNDVKSEE